MTNRQFRFSLAMPANWAFLEIAGAGSGVRYGAPGGYSRVQVDFSASPNPDAAEDWRKADQEMTSPGYRRLSIRQVDYRGYRTAADWEFTYTRNGERMRVLNRGFVVDDNHAYAIMFTARASEWDSAASTTARKTFFKTFEPMD